MFEKDYCHFAVTCVILFSWLSTIESLTICCKVNKIQLLNTMQNTLPKLKYACCVFVIFVYKRDYLQIVRGDRSMEQIVFPVPSVCKYLTQRSKDHVIASAERDEKGSKV